jgi:type II secretory pathway pseudopilin PulG
MSKGFTIPEIAIVMMFIIILLTWSSVNLLGSHRRAINTTTVDTLVSDISSQQATAMAGDTSNTGTSSMYGIYFQADRYILFKGSSYSTTDPRNFTITLNPTVRFSNILFPSSQIQFAVTSGAMQNYAVNQDSITISDSGAGWSKVLKVNANGVVQSVQ